MHWFILRKNVQKDSYEARKSYVISLRLVKTNPKVQKGDY